MPSINIDNANAATNVPAGYDAFLGPGAVNDTITLNGTDTLHGGLDLNSNSITATGENTIHVINAVITVNGGSVETINGVGAFNDIVVDTVNYNDASLVYLNNSGIAVSAPSGYGLALEPNAVNDTITLVGNDTLHSSLDLNSNTINVSGNNAINVSYATINGTGGNDTISGKGLYTNVIYINGSGNNTVYSGNGSTVLDSSSGNDKIYAQSLINEHGIYLGSGNDTLEVRDGVAGAQVPGNLDTVTVHNFVPGRDVIALNTAAGSGQINAGNIANIMDNAFGYHGLYTELVLGGMSIIFQGVTYSSLHASDFILTST